jgi:hypothetical protein
LRSDEGCKLIKSDVGLSVNLKVGEYEFLFLGIAGNAQSTDQINKLFFGKSALGLLWGREVKDSLRYAVWVAR